MCMCKAYKHSIRKLNTSQTYLDASHVANNQRYVQEPLRPCGFRLALATLHVFLHHTATVRDARHKRIK